jgi:hypothetical protein
MLQPCSSFLDVSQSFAGRMRDERRTNAGRTSRLARIPHRHGDLEALNFVRAFRRELTQYPESSSADLVMAHWMAEWNLGRIIRAGRHGAGSAIVDVKLPAYQRRQQHEIPLSRRRCSHETAEEPVISGGGMEGSRPHTVIYVTWEPSSERLSASDRPIANPPRRSQQRYARRSQ